MRRALEILAREAPDLEVDGEMHGDMALSEELRRRIMPVSRLSGERTCSFSRRSTRRNMRSTS
jgi:malate dehydrogenase (oxaloacetate-decarboxylating)(NADP+)